MIVFFSGLNGSYWNTTKTAYAGNGTAGNSTTRLSSPFGLAFDVNNSLYVGDAGNRRVIKFPFNNNTGTIVASKIAPSPQGLYELGTDDMYVYLDASQNLYVSDCGNHRVLRYANGNATGSIVAGNETAGAELNQLNCPLGIWVDSSSNLFIADLRNHRVMKWAQNATTGILVAGVTGAAGMNIN